MALKVGVVAQRYKNFYWAFIAENFLIYGIELAESQRTKSHLEYIKKSVVYFNLLLLMIGW
jgi:hypothetical protein